MRSVRRTGDLDEALGISAPIRGRAHDGKVDAEEEEEQPARGCAQGGVDKTPGTVDLWSTCLGDTYPTHGGRSPTVDLPEDAPARTHGGTEVDEASSLSD